MIKKQIRIWKCISEKMQRDNLPSFSAHAALFIIMSIFPMEMFLITFIRHLPIQIESVIKYANEYLPDTVLPLVLQIINEVYGVTGSGIKWITFLTMLYCGSKGFYAIRIGLNAVYGIKESRNIVVRNLISIIYAIAFAIMLIITIFIAVLGGDLFRIAIHYIPVVFEYKRLISVGRIILMLIILTVFFTAMYFVIPNRKTKLKYEIRGAVLAAIGWTVFSYGFSFYKANIAQYTVIYGSLATIVVIMLWFYCSMYIFFLGAECNYFYRKYLESGRDIERTIKIISC